MSKLVILSILAATVLVAGMFAFMPVNKASTVHTLITPDINNLIQTSSIAAATNLNDPAVTLVTATLAGLACFEVNFTDDTDVGPTDDPAVAIINGVITVATANPANNVAATLTGCTPVAAGDVITVDQQGADTDTGNTVNWATVTVISDT